jgi:hypothetical protein
MPNGLHIQKGRGPEVTCNVCNLNKELFLYTKGDLVYSLCESCLYTQNQIDILHTWQREQIAIAKESGETPY